MDIEILTLWDIEIEKNKFYCHKSPFLKEMQILRKYWYLTRFLLMKKTINTLLITCIMIKKLSHYI